MLCSICHQRPATVPLTTMMDGSQQCQDFCTVCAPSFIPEMNPWAERMAGKACDFCGAPATQGGGPPGKERFCCETCNQQFGDILQQVCAETPKHPNPEQYARWIEQVTQEAERRMRGRKDQG